MKKYYKSTALLIVLALAGLGLAPTALGQRPYRQRDGQMRQLIQRLERRTNQFSKLLPDALDRSRINGTNREDNVNEFVTNFEHATNTLKERFNDGQSTATDAQTVLQEGARIDTFMRRQQLDYRTERSWIFVRNELNQLANAYGVSRNWATMQWPTTPTGPSLVNYDALLTGTFQLDRARSNDPRTIARNATQGLPFRERQNVYDNLINRLTPPDMLALERHGNIVMLASSRSPQVSLDVDSRERTENYPDGQASHITATFVGNGMKVVSNGNRPNDFTATFTPIDNGRRLIVTREIYAERLSRPVRVESYYNQTSNLARWNVYDNNRRVEGVDTNDSFVMVNGTQLVAVLNNNLSTKSARNNDRFTMSVRSPAEFEGATLEGHVTNVNRGGRVSGRSDMTLNFDRIRLRDGRTYKFAGIVQNVTASNGESASVDNEGAVRENDSRTNTTLERTGIGTALGALIGAIAGGGKGAAIGAVIGAGTGAGSVYVQGRDDLDLASGTEFNILATAPQRIADTRNN